MTEIFFDDNRAATYELRNPFKQAVLVSVPKGTVMTIVADWGEQTIRGGWYGVLAEDGATIKYGVPEEEFLGSHTAVLDIKNGWRKLTTIQAYRYEGPEGFIVTRLANGHKETKNEVRSGDWLVQWTGGEAGKMSPEKFESLYRLKG